MWAAIIFGGIVVLLSYFAWIIWGRKGEPGSLCRGFGTVSTRDDEQRGKAS